MTHLIPWVRPHRANALRCSKMLPTFLSIARYAFPAYASLLNVSQLAAQGKPLVAALL